MEPILTPEIIRLEGDIQSIKSRLDAECESTIQMIKHMSPQHYTELLQKQYRLYKQLEDVCEEYQKIAVPLPPDESLSSQKKYLKYKMKYLNMLQQIGGRM
jgi:hypothetical protein